MFGAGFTELLLVFVIGLLILGPERLPRVAAQIGRWIGRARRTANQLRYQLEREIALEEVTRPRKKQPPRQEPAAPPPDAETGATGTAGEPGAAPAGSAEGESAEAEVPPTIPRAAAAAVAEPGARVTVPDDAPSVHSSPVAERTSPAADGDGAAPTDLEPPAKQSTGR